MWAVTLNLKNDFNTGRYWGGGGGAGGYNNLVPILATLNNAVVSSIYNDQQSEVLFFRLQGY